MTKPNHAWMIRTGDDNELADIIEDKSAVAIGWSKMENVSDLKDREQFKERYNKAYLEDSQSRVNINAGQIYRFVREIREDLYILTYVKASREYIIGLMEGYYEYRNDIFPEHYRHVRKVQ